MKILVCLKQVPDTTKIKTDPKTSTLIRAGVPSILNPSDHFALEQALKIKEQYGAEITAISMGLPQAKSVLRLALALGVDKTFLISDRALAGSDTWATAYTLSQATKKLGNFDLILCGQMAIDGDTAQVGPELAGQLNIPQITCCTSLNIEGNNIIATQEADDKIRTLQTTFPCLLTMKQSKDYSPKYPSFEQIFRSQKGILGVLSATALRAEKENIGLQGSPTRVSKIYTPPSRQKGKIIHLSPQETAKQIYALLVKEQIVK